MRTISAYGIKLTNVVSHDCITGVTTFYPDSIEPRYFGPCCPCHGRRNMERMGYCLYRCQTSGETFQMLVHDGHIAMVSLPQAEAMADLK